MLKRIAGLLKTHLNTFGLYHGIRKILITSIYKRLTDSVMADHVYAKSSLRYVEKFYKKHNSEFNFSHPANDIKENELVYWTCWLQGLNSAPALVKACINSAEKISCGHRIIVITYENLQTYVSLPDFILEKHKNGCIQAAHFADILRAYLLYTYGGLWFDSTVFFTQPVPEQLLKENIFFFRSPLDDAFCPVSNWFIIAAKKENPLLYKLLCALLEYWRVKNKYIDYFIFHYFLQAIIQNNPESAIIFNKIPYRSNQEPHFLQIKLLPFEFDSELWENARNTSFCHKLTYKSYPMNKDSFFSFICEQ